MIRMLLVLAAGIAGLAFVPALVGVPYWLGRRQRKKPRRTPTTVRRATTAEPQVSASEVEYEVELPAWTPELGLAGAPDRDTRNLLVVLAELYECTPQSTRQRAQWN